MKKFTAISCILFPWIAGAAPEVINGSFEMNSAPAWPGTCAIVGWVGSWDTGINPVSVDTTAGGVSPHVFDDNGIIPHGTNVAFLQGGPLDYQSDTFTVSLLQPINGFEAGKSYSVSYFCNGRASTAAPKLTVKLGDVVVDGQVTIPAVEGLNLHTRPYRKRFSREFLASSPGPFVLQFAMISSGTHIYAAGTPSFPADAGLVLDDVRIIELGDTRVLTARRFVQDHTRVEISCSAPLDKSSAEDRLNYRITSSSSSAGIVSARLESDLKTITLKTDTLFDDTDYAVELGAVLDANGKGMFRDKARMPIDFRPRLPVEIGTTVNAGFLDDFNGTARNPAWKFAGAGADRFEPWHGVLRVRETLAASDLLLNQEYDRVNQQILARIRVTRMDSAEASGGLSLAARTDSGLGVSWIFTNGISRETAFLKEPAAAQKLAGAWQKGPWYWLRVVQTNENGSLKVGAKLWESDGDAPEPPNFVFWNLPAGPSEGLAGIAGLQSAGAAEMEVDWILVQAAGLPSIPVTAPEPRQVLMTIRSLGGGDLEMSWPLPEGRDYQIESSTDVSPFAMEGVEGSRLEQDGQVVFRYTVPFDGTHRFFRLFNPAGF